MKGGNNKVKGKQSSTANKTIRRRRVEQEKAKGFLRKCFTDSTKDVCIVCGEFMTYCLDHHHIETKKKNSRDKVTICASCHRIFDKMGGIEELKSRRKRYWNYNLRLREVIAFFEYKPKQLEKWETSRSKRL